MADDIVARLRINADQIEWEQPLAADRHRAAADEIERLRTAGDALEAALLGETVNGSMAVFNDTFTALNAWKEARRG